LEAETGLLRPGHQRAPVRRRQSDPEIAQHLLAQTARGQVLADLLGPRRLPEEAGVELGRPAQELAQPVAPASSLGLARVFGLALELDAVAFGQELDRLGEADALGLLDEIEQVAARLAAEAVV